MERDDKAREGGRDGDEGHSQREREGRKGGGGGGGGGEIEDTARLNHLWIL